MPRQGLILRAEDVYLIPFSLLWGGFVIFWEVSVLSTDAPFFFKLWGVPFVLVGLYIMVGRFFADARQRGKTYYGVTNERVIIVSGLLSRKVKSLNLRTLIDISLDEKSDGSGTITFGATNPMSWWSGGMSFPRWGPQPTPSFELIREARKVYEIIRSVQRQPA
ncbi:PH domain-containing protein [Leptolyngbya sp. GB1-A1]|uniref:PH domain-containing protein n=1 Tax=Leptolyngbya sp. GB1-A1 TaxID=2933908 RepID=UPI003298B598